MIAGLTYGMMPFEKLCRRLTVPSKIESITFCPNSPLAVELIAIVFAPRGNTTVRMGCGVGGSVNLIVPGVRTMGRIGWGVALDAKLAALNNSRRSSNSTCAIIGRISLPGGFALATEINRRNINPPCLF
jgi:hypothetical protein